MANFRREKPPRWDVTIAEHAVRMSPTRTIIVPEHTQTKLHSPTERNARRDAIYEAYRTYRVPPMKPCMRESWPHTKATPHKDPYER